ncbi:hypothetical protein [uncultured Gemmiger sp.]|nr:hypothetical protein [uncultured Gemmiger sp.]
MPYGLYISVGIGDAAIIAPCVFYFIRRKNMKHWKEQNSLQA